MSDFEEVSFRPFRSVPLKLRYKTLDRFAMVDEADYETVSRFRWRLWEEVLPGRRTHGPYAATSVLSANGRPTTLFMHKLITGYERTDHIDHCGLNNRRDNLRPATSRQNAQNARKRLGCTSVFKGVFWHSRAGKWGTSIRVNGRQKLLGFFEVEEAAALAYDAAAREHFGEFACLNFQSDAELAEVDAIFAQIDEEARFEYELAHAESGAEAVAMIRSRMQGAA